MLAPEMAGAATQRYAGNGPKFERLGGMLVHKNSICQADWQLLGDVAERRTAWIARRFRLAPTMARAVAFLAFEEGR